MADIQADVIRLCTTTAALESAMREKMFGFDTTLHHIKCKAPGGTIYNYTPNGGSPTFADVTATGTMYASAGIYGYGDTDTGIAITEDQLAVQAGGVTFMSLTETTQDVLTINPGSTDIDFIVNANGAESFRVNGANGYLGIATIAPRSVLDVNGNIYLGGQTGTANKGVVLVGSQYDSGAETEGYVGLKYRAIVTDNILYYGGGDSGYNAATIHYFYTAADTVTRNGTLALTIDNSQNITLGGNEILASTKYVGLGAAKGRFVFTDTTLDTIIVTDAAFAVNTALKAGYYHHVYGGALFENAGGETLSYVDCGATNPGEVPDPAIGEFRFVTGNSVGTQKAFGFVYGAAVSNTSGAEYGRMSLWTIQNGSTTEFIRLDSDGISLLRNVTTPLTLGPGDCSIAVASSTSDVGGALEIKAGDGNGTDQNGGATSVYPGKSTGTGLSCVRLGRNGRAASTGSTLNAVQDGLIVACEKVLSTESITSFFEVAVADNTMGGGHIDFTITATDGTDYVAHTGSAYYSFCSKAGTMDADIAEVTPAAGGEVESSSSAAAITSGWSIVEDEANNKVTVRITATVGSMTATSVKMYAMIANNSMNAITLL